MDVGRPSSVGSTVHRSWVIQCRSTDSELSNRCACSQPFSSVHVPVMRPIASHHLEFPEMMDYNLEWQGKISPFPLNCFMSGYFITAVKMKPGQAPHLNCGDFCVSLCSLCVVNLLPCLAIWRTGPVDGPFLIFETWETRVIIIQVRKCFPMRSCSFLALVLEFITSQFLLIFIFQYTMYMTIS